MGTLRKWLQTRNEGNILGKSINYTQKVLECVVEFERGFSFLVNEKNYPLALEVFSRVDRIEHEADVMRRDMMLLVAKSDMDPNSREDFAGLINAIDEIANMTNASGRRLNGLQEAHVRAMGEPALKKMVEMVQTSVEATKILFNLIKRFTDLDNKEVFSITEQIQRLEHKCDVYHYDILKDLKALPSFPYNAFVAIDLKDIVDMTEGISDRVEDVADYIELLKTVLR